MPMLIYDVFVDATRKHANDTVAFSDETNKAIAVTMIIAASDMYLAREYHTVHAKIAQSGAKRKRFFV